MSSSTGVPGSTASVGAVDAQQLAGQVGQQDREGHLERQVGTSRLEGEDRAGQPVARARRTAAARRAARDDRPRPGRAVVQLAPRRCAWSRGRRSAGRARRCRASRCPGSSSVPVTSPSGAGPRRRDREDRACAAARRQEALEDDRGPGRPPCARSPGRTRLGSRRTARRRAGTTARSRGTGRPRRRAARAGSGRAARPPTPGRRPPAGRAPRSRRDPAGQADLDRRTSRGRSSMTTSARACGSSRTSRTSIRRPSA